MVCTSRRNLAAIGENSVIVLAAVTGAYLLTSGGFFLWSGLYEGWTLGQYWEMSASFFLIALGSTVGYIVLGLIAQQMTEHPVSRSKQLAS